MLRPLAFWGALALCSIPAFSQQSGTIRGTVKLERNGDPLHHATVYLVEVRRSAESNEEGVYEFRDLAPGKYTVVAHLHPFSDERKTVEVAAGGAGTADFAMRIAAIHEEVNVTSRGVEQLGLESFQTVQSIEQLDLLPRTSTGLGETLEGLTGVAKRSFGPGSSRPVIRGFDGDRVLIMQDGLPTGTLSSQSGDHGEPFDSSAVERIEIVRGPATLLWGTNALGGVVNVITGQIPTDLEPRDDVHGFLSTNAGSTNGQFGGSGGVDFGLGKWMFAAAGGGLRTGDYGTPIGNVFNSGSRLQYGNGSVARYGERAFFNFNFGMWDGRYGIPFPAEERFEEPGDTIDWRRYNGRFTGGFKNINSYLDRLTVQLNYSDWLHRELEGPEVGTELFNKIFSYRAVVDQKKRGRWSGSFGVSGLRRDYETIGEESLAPPTIQNNFAAFGLQEFDFERFKLQFGGRVENNRFRPNGGDVRDRSFTGFSGSAGINTRLWTGGSFVATYSHSYRAPAIEELYNFGPHPGNLAFEIGSQNLRRERGDGVELSLRQNNSRFRGELNFFYYGLKDFIYLAPTGEVEDDLFVAEYLQGNARYFGAEARADVRLTRSLWLNAGFDMVRAELRADSTPLPRIPPLRGRLGFDWRWKGFGINPYFQFQDRQDRVFLTETETPGAAVFHLNASYTWASRHLLHAFNVLWFNATDRLYFNHTSFIKGFAPEIGRGARVSYTMRFF